MPSFAEWVPYFLDKGPFKISRKPKANNNSAGNVHFLPFYHRCDVCNLHLDYIGKVETSDEDKNWILADKLGLKLGPDLLGLKLNKSGGGGEEATKGLAMFKTIKKSQVRALYELLRLDFELFDYDIEPYLTAAIPD